MGPLPSYGVVHHDRGEDVLNSLSVRVNLLRLVFILVLSRRRKKATVHLEAVKLVPETQSGHQGSSDKTPSSRRAVAERHIAYGTGGLSRVGSGLDNVLNVAVLRSEERRVGKECRSRW